METPNTQAASWELAEKIVRLTGFGQALHINDILPDIKDFASKERAEGERAILERAKFKIQVAAHLVEGSKYDYVRGLSNAEEIIKELLKEYTLPADSTEDRVQIRYKMPPLD